MNEEGASAPIPQSGSDRGRDPVDVSPARPDEADALTDERWGTFNPASGTAYEEAEAIGPDAACENCGGSIDVHRDGGLVYGLICPETPRPEGLPTDGEMTRGWPGVARR